MSDLINPFRTGLFEHISAPLISWGLDGIRVLIHFVNDVLWNVSFREVWMPRTLQNNV